MFAAIALSAGLVGCGSSEDEGEGEQPVKEGPATLQIFFPKLYSAYIEGSSQEFLVPAVVGGVKPDSWECSDPDAVSFNMDLIDNGVMITTRKAGSFKIIARSGRQWGEADIEITASTEEEFKVGEGRYNNAIMLDFMGLRPVMMGQMPVMQNASCKNCHGSGAMALAVEHTPQQTGGYSDEEIRKIFSMGMKPPGAKYGSFPGIAMFYPLFHRWAATDEEYQGLVVYLRSLKPMSQGPLDFMGLIDMFRRNNMMNAGRAGAGGARAAAGSGAAGSAAAGAGGEEEEAAGTGGEEAAAGAGGEEAAAGAGGEPAAGAGGEPAAGAGGEPAAGAGGEPAAGAGGEPAAGAGGAAAGAGGEAAGAGGA